VELITEYLEDALPPEMRARVDDHVADCDGCTAYFEQYRTTIRLTGMLTEDQVAPEARDALLRVFRGGPSL
jgi:hypothetical protein